MIRFFQIAFLLLMILRVSSELNAQGVWPKGAKAAICLTYDDGLDNHLDIAIPQLNKFGFKGTFFCTGNSPCLYNRMEEWRKAVKKGHELGNHSLFHPCNGKSMDWVKPEYDLRNYTLDQMISELTTANTLLKAVDGKNERTYGYTCSHYSAGGVDFIDKIKPLFLSARCDGPVPETMSGYDVYKTPSWCVDSPSAGELIAYAEKAKKNGTIAVFMFHNVGGGYLNVGSEEHRKLLEYLHKNRKDYYIGTFMEVMKTISHGINSKS